MGVLETGCVAFVKELDTIWGVPAPVWIMRWVPKVRRQSTTLIGAGGLLSRRVHAPRMTAKSPGLGLVPTEPKPPGEPMDGVNVPPMYAVEKLANVKGEVVLRETP